MSEQGKSSSDIYTGAHQYDRPVNSLLIVLALGIMAIRLPSIDVANQGVLLIVMGVLFAVIWASACYWHRASWLDWAGFLAVLAAWTLLGVAVAVIVMISGTLLALLGARLQPRSAPHSIWQAIRYLAVGSIGILIAALLYYLMDLAALTTYITPLVLGSIAFCGGSLASFVLLFIQNDSHEQVSHRFVLVQVVRLLVASLSLSLLLPVVYQQMGLWALAAVASLVTGYFAMTGLWADDAYGSNVDDDPHGVSDIAQFVRLSAQITAQSTLNDTITCIYREIQQLLKPDQLYVGLYHADSETIDYHLGDANDRQVTPYYALAGSVDQYVIKERQAICLSRAAIIDHYGDLVDHHRLLDQQYMIVPMILSEKVLGIIGISHATNPQAFTQHDFDLFQAITTQAGLAIRNSMLYERTTWLAQNMGEINNSLQDIMFNLDADEALKTACQIAKQVTRADKAAIYLLDTQSTNRMTCREAIGFEDTAFEQTIFHDPSLFTDGATVIKFLDEHTPADIRQQAEAGEFQACMRVPLQSEQTLVGLLMVCHNAPYNYRDTEINLLEIVSNQVNAALDNADLLQVLELYASEQAQLVHLSRITNSSLDLDRIIYELCDFLGVITSASRVTIGLWQADSDTLEVLTPDAATYHLHKQLVPLSDIPEFRQLLSLNTVHSIYIYHQPGTYSVGLQQYMLHHEDHTLALLPLHMNGEAQGLIILGDDDHKQFNDNERLLLETASHQIAVQIHNARIHRLTEEQLLQGLEKLGLIEDISQQISQLLDSQVIIERVLKAAMQATQADFGSVLLLQSEQRHIYDVTWMQKHDERVYHEYGQYAYGGVVEKVIETGKMLMVPDHEIFPNYVSPTQVARHYDSSLAVPIQVENYVIGIINLESDQKDFFTAELASFIRSIAGHAGISWNNALLLEQREDQIQVLTYLRELSLHALRYTDSKDVVRSILNTSLVLMKADEVMLYEYDKKHDHIRALDGLQVDKQEIIRHLDPYIDIEVLKHAIEDSELLFIPNLDLFSKERVNQNFDETIRESYSLITIPIIRRGDIREILCIGFRSVYEFTSKVVNTLNLLAVQLASHLQNADLSDRIRSSNNRMRAILDSTHDGILLVNREHRLQDANNAAHDLFQVPLRDYLGEPLIPLLKKRIVIDHVNMQEWERLLKLYEQSPNHVHEKEFAFIRNGQPFQTRLLVTSVVNEQGANVGHLIIIRDVTEERQLQKFRETMQSMVLHDINGPLSSIITSMYVAQNVISLSDDDLFDETIKQTVEVSLESANDLMRMTETIRDLPMIAKMQVDCEWVHAFHVAERSYLSLLSNMQSANITVELDVPKDLMIWVDQSLIRRVFVNLLHNAFKFTPENGTILIRVTELDAQFVQVQLADTGPGIPEAERERIFGQFIQIEGRKPRAGGKGTGLGLNFCKLAVEAHGGRIWVAKESPLAGACFVFTLPRDDQAIKQLGMSNPSKRDESL